jgi:carotenoid cleavage dioxygenase-like enzyme
MSVTALPCSPKAWSKAIAQPAREFSATSLPVLSGKIPDQLRGSLYRNGPGRLQRGGKRVGHWFDGDGAILAVHFTDAGATGVYRYVQTEGYQQEEAADTFIYPNYGMTAPGVFWNNWFKEVKNAANTSVLALSGAAAPAAQDRLLALWEGGFPHALDLETLETWGTDNLSGLSKDRPFSAHPKIDPQTREIYNFGVGAGLNTTLNLYRSDRTGTIKQQNSFSLNGLPLIHDFILAGRYLVFFVPPVRVNFLPVILGSKCYSDSMEWKPELGTQILIFDRETLSLVSRNEAEPWYQWHIANGYEDRDGSIVTEILRYQDFQTNQYLKEIATGRTETLAKGTLWQIRLDPQTGKVIEMAEILNRGCEFPVVPQHQVGQPWHNTYLSIHRDGVDISQEIFGAIACFNRQTGNLSLADMGENRYPSEPIYVPHPDNPERGWLLTVVYDGNTDSSEVRIYESHVLETEPVCRLGLPSVIPPSFHGIWQPG